MHQQEKDTSVVKRVAMYTYRGDFDKCPYMNKAAEKFDGWTEQQLKDELKIIEKDLNGYVERSVLEYRVAMGLYNIICKRHNLK
jgi:hypothetical protein